MWQEKLIEAYALLKGLRDNLPQADTVEEKYVAQFHQILGIREKVTGADLANFRVPASEVRRRYAGGDGISSWYTDFPECDRPYLMMKVDGVLTLFLIQQSSEKKVVGFSHGH